MDFQELMTQRCSVRGYKPEAVEEEKLQAVLEAARMAPTAKNLQAFQLLVIHTAGRQEELAQIYFQPWFVQAPLVLAFCATPDVFAEKPQNWRDYREINAGIVASHIALAAAEQGLGTCIIGAFDIPAAQRVLGIPEQVYPVLLMTLGYADANATRPKARKALADLVRYENW